MWLLFVFILFFDIIISMQSKAKDIFTNILSGLTVFVCLVIFLFSVCFLTFNLSYSKTRVRGFSMLPTINSNVDSSNEDGDMVYINTHKTLSRNDVVVANVSWWKTGSIIKRLVGVPGDVIQISETADEYQLKVNGELLYTRSKYDSNGDIDTNVRGYYRHKYQTFINNLSSFDGNHLDHSQNIDSFEGELCIKLNEDEYFLMGDNWSDAMVDCMTFGPIHRSEIVGMVDFIIDVNENIIFKVGYEMLKVLFAV